MATRGKQSYQFRDAVNGFFEFPIANARAILPTGLQPVELHHGAGVLTITSFEFHDSPVGPYDELVFCVVVAPRIVSGEPMPRAAMCPVLVGTSTKSARDHGIELWHLPHHMRDIHIEFAREEREIRVDASEGGSPILSMAVTDTAGVEWQPVEHLYQTFMVDHAGAFMSRVVMTGDFLEHEEERGSLRLYPHAFNAALELDEVVTTPFREQWMKRGMETFHPIQELATLTWR